MSEEFNEHEFWQEIDKTVNKPQHRLDDTYKTHVQSLIDAGDSMPDGKVSVKFILPNKHLAIIAAESQRYDLLMTESLMMILNSYKTLHDRLLAGDKIIVLRFTKRWPFINIQEIKLL